MEWKSLPDLLKSPDHYLKSFNAYKTSILKFSKYTAWVDGVLSEAVVDKLQAVMGRQEELRILGVGSGDGSVDYTILKRLLHHFPRINNRVVEPFSEQLRQYKALALSKAHELPGVDHHWRQQTIEQYQKEGDLTKFHFVSAIHTLYYVEKSSLMYLYDCLEPGGVLLVVLESENSGMSQLWYHFLQDQPRYVSSADLQSSLERRGIPHKKIRQRCHIDITMCFGETSAEGKMLMDFFSHVVDFDKVASKGFQRSMMEYLASSHCSKKCGDEVWLIVEWDAVVISKPRE
ncbi:histamine N-methyltransferase-like isoform X2 [Acanthaster planci]|nr:histamine N-methyltransferase-like isoform X2 [Acanthaster planci]XP_022080433.1 histamine N-methyltransferase-like isoform X2 [Acanthaster planci]XP_022080434.1 histamine N-methyltransferase-like isoform X2 [Acanthaster planci]